MRTDKPLTRRQEIGLAALLAASTVTNAAKESGIGKRTFDRWLTQPHFAAVYREKRRQFINETVARVQGRLDGAVACLDSVMTDPNSTSASKVSAAKALIDLALRGLEIDGIEARLDAIEKKIGRMGGDLK